MKFRSLHLAALLLLSSTVSTTAYAQASGPFTGTITFGTGSSGLTAATISGAPSTAYVNAPITGVVDTLTPSGATAYVALNTGGVDQGSRTSFTGTSVPSLTPTSTGTFVEKIYAASSGGTALATSGSISVGYATATAATISGAPSTGSQSSPITGVADTLTPAYARAYAVLKTGGADEGTRQAFTGTSIPSLTPQSTGTYAIAVYAAATGGTALATSSSITVGAAATVNAAYPLPEQNYTCSTNYYVNASTGSDGNPGTSQGSAFATMTHAASVLNGSHPGLCINVAPGTYAGGVNLDATGTINNATGWAVWRCAINSSTATAQPALYEQSGGSSGSLPGCHVTDNGSTSQGGILATSDGTHLWNYVGVDGFDVSSTQTATASVSGLSYNSGTGLVTLTLAASDNIIPAMGFTVSGLTGTGSIASANGYQWAAAGSTGTTLTYYIGTGLTLGYTSGGTVARTSGGSVGIGTGPGNPKPAAHHLFVINSVFHDLGGSGITTGNSDNNYFHQNVVYNTSWFSGYGESGIDVVVPDAATYTAGTWDATYGSVNGHEVRMVISDNYAFHNGNNDSNDDGEGIIYDTARGSGATGCVTSTYAYGALITGNVVYENGGRGIHAFLSNYAAILNNTAYDNNRNINSYSGGNLSVQCGSYNLVENNIGYTITSGGGQTAINTPALSTGNSSNGNAVGNIWHNNMLYVVGTPVGCGNFGSAGNGVSCYNGFDSIYNAATEPATWASGTTYTNNNSYALGSDGNVYASTASSNIGNNPVTDGGVHWQNNGPPDNVFPTNPLLTSPASASPATIPSMVLQSGSPALAASTAAVTGLGGYSVATPNIGAN